VASAFSFQLRHCFMTSGDNCWNFGNISELGPAFLLFGVYRTHKGLYIAMGDGKSNCCDLCTQDFSLKS